MSEPVQCRAHAKSTGKRCTRKALPGGLVCRYHGGAAKQVKAAAQRRLARERLMEEITGLGYSITVDAEEALAAMVGEAAGNVSFLRQRIDLIEADNLIGTDHNGDEAQRALVKLYNEERDRLARFCRMAIDAGLSERMVKVAEQQAEAIAAMVGELIDDPRLGLNAEQRKLARVVGAERLRSLSG